MKKQIFKEITLMNAFLCFSVIMIHLTSAPLGGYTLGSIPHGVVFFINKILSFSVPAFLFLSGFKLWAKYGGERFCLKDFFFGRFMKIVIPYVISVSVYFIYFFRMGWVPLSELPQYYLLGTLVAHFYYVIIALQLYLLFPLLNYLVKRFPLVTTAVAFVSTVVFCAFVQFKYSDRFFGSYIFYFILGMIFAKYKPYDRFRRLGIVSVVLFLMSAVVHMGYLYLAAVGRIVYPSEPLMHILYVTSAIGAIYFVSIKLNDKLQPVHNFAKVVGGASYDIYLYHILGIFILQYDIYPRLSLSVTEKFIISSVLIFSIAVVYSYVAAKVKSKLRSVKKS